MNKEPIKKEMLIELINKNMSSHDIAKHLNCSQCRIMHWLKKYNLKTKYSYRNGSGKTAWEKGLKALLKYNKSNSNPNKNNYKQYNWQEIQVYYDNGKSWKDIKEKFNISFNSIANAKKDNLFKSRKAKETWLIRNPTRKGRKHSQETKDKLRVVRLNYLKENPESCSWKKNDKFKSIPCELVKKELNELNIIFKEEYQPLLNKKRFFSIDISFPERKIGFEINGNQHYDTNSNLKPYYQERHNLIESEGWILYEIPYHVAMRKGFVNDFIVPILNNLNPIYDLTLYRKSGASGKLLKLPA